MSKLSEKRRTHCIANKPHIYFHRYPSGLGFWRVRKPKTWSSWKGISIDCRAILTAAYKHANFLNSHSEIQP
jgi:hypothetical protein